RRRRPGPGALRALVHLAARLPRARGAPACVGLRRRVDGEAAEAEGRAKVVRRIVRRGLAGLLLVAVAASGAPPVAHANGDPASDILPLRDSYLPFQPHV